MWHPRDMQVREARLDTCFQAIMPSYVIDQTGLATVEINTECFRKVIGFR